MNQDDEKIAESAWREGFCQRLREVQGDRTQDDMAYILGTSRDSWNKYVNRGSAVPIRLLPKIAKIGAKSLEWLIEGEPVAKAVKTPARQPKQARQR